LNLCGSRHAMRQGICYANYYNKISRPIWTPDIIKTKLLRAIGLY